MSQAITFRRKNDINLNIWYNRFLLGVTVLLHVPLGVFILLLTPVWIVVLIINKFRPFNLGKWFP